MSAAALFAGLLTSSSGAWAQCTNNFGGPGIPPGFPVNAFFPFGQGGGVNSLVSAINTVNTAFLTGTTAFVSAPGGPPPDQQGGGVWARAIGGTVDTQSTGVTTIPSVLGLAVTGSQTCNSNTRQDYSGFQVGHDISILNGGGSGANWHFGATAGYFQANSKDISAGPPAPSFTGNFQVPFIGLYTAFTKGNFFADGQARWDFYQNELTDPANGLASQRLDARGFALTGNIGYNIPLHHNWFVEPSGGVVWSTTHVNPLDVAGPSIGGGFFLPGTVQIQDVESVLGRLSVRVGTSFSSGHITWQPYFTTSVFHEFAGNVTSTLSSPVLGSVATLDTSRVGTYAQFGLGTAAVLGNTGWLGYVRGDYRIGENIEGWGINAGLRYQFTPEPGRRSIKDGPVTAGWNTYNWTGPYLGLSAGATRGEEHWFAPAFGTTANPDFAGYLLGGQAGYNLQFGRFVVGIEGDYGFSNARGGSSCPNAFFFTCSAEADRLASVAARVGYASGRALFYAKGGWAGGNVSVLDSNNIGLPQPPSNTPVNGETKWVNGWTAGGGMEFALTNQWSAKAEYMYYDLGSTNYSVDGPTLVEVDTRGSTLRVGVNYHFHSVQETAPLK